MTSFLTPRFAVLILLAFAANSARPAGPGLTVARDGRSALVIVHAADAPASVRTAAAEVRHYVEKVARARLPVLTGDELPKTPFLSLGDTAAARAAGISAKDVPLEGFRLVTRDGNLFILGPDTADGGLTPQGGTSTGTLNGAYAFIEEYLGVRWLLPGEMGEDAPQQDAIVVPAVDRTERPFFQNRRVPGMQNEEKAVQQWSARQRLGFSMKLEHSHNWQQVVPASMHTAHPDWFAELGGARPPPVGDRYKLETTNPELVEHFARTAIEAFRRDPKRAVFSLSPTDSDNWSTSAASKALYDKDPHGKRSVTPLVLKFYNDVARRVAREFPDRKVAGYVYESYLYPPSAGVPPIEPNLILVVAPSISYGYQLYRESVRLDWEMLVKAWSAGPASRVAYYDCFNWLKGSSGALTPPAPEILNFAFPRLKRYGISGVYIYGTAEWSQAAVNNYALARMAWDPGLDADAVCDEFYRRAYGAAAGAVVRTLYHRIDAAAKAFYIKDPTARYTATPRYMNDVLAANYPAIEAAYREATVAVGGDGDGKGAVTPAQRARLAFLGDDLIVMNWQLRARGFLAEDRASPLYRPDAEVERMLGRVHAGFGVALAPGLKPAERAFPPVRAEWAPAVPNARPIAPIAFRGDARLLFFPRTDRDIRVTPTRMSGVDGVVRYDAYDASGTKVAGGAFRAGVPINFLGSAGQIYYVQISAGGAYYELDVQGAPYAVAADPGRRGLRLQGKVGPLYFRVPADATAFDVTVATAAPGETSVCRLYTPGGKLAATLDTQTAPAARAAMTRPAAGEDWAGFWCLSVEKAPRGALGDVFVALGTGLPQWFTLDPAEPLSITPLARVPK